MVLRMLIRGGMLALRAWRWTARRRVFRTSIVALRALGAPVWAFVALIVPFFGAYTLAYQALFRT